MALVYWEFDTKMTFEKHLRSVSRASSQILGILRKSWQVYHNRSLFGRCIRGFVLPVLEYCSAVWCSAADTHLKLLDRVVSGASFLTGDVFEFDIAHHQSVAVLRMLYKIMCNPSHPLYGRSIVFHMCQFGLQAVLWSYIGILMSLLAVEPRSTVGPLFPSQCPFGTILKVSVYL